MCGEFPSSDRLATTTKNPEFLTALTGYSRVGFHAYLLDPKHANLDLPENISFSSSPPLKYSFSVVFSLVECFRRHPWAQHYVWLGAGGVPLALLGGLEGNKFIVSGKSVYIGRPFALWLQHNLLDCLKRVEGGELSEGTGLLSVCYRLSEV